MRKTLTKESFIQKAVDIHGNKFDYSHVVFVNNSTNVEIQCQHGHSFQQTPSNHLQGKGCKFCARNVKLTTELFIEKSRSTHSEKYDYSKVKYINLSTEVEIVCLTHGSFGQLPDNHLMRKRL
jgi:hypothetical protein